MAGSQDSTPSPTSSAPALPLFQRSWFAPTVLLAPTLLWLIFFYIAPIALMVWRGLMDTGLQGYIKIFSSDIYLKVFWNTLQISIITTIGCLVLGYPIAFALTVVGRRLQALILVLVTLPYWLDYVVRSYSWIVLLGRRGLINNILVGLGIVDQPLPLLFNLFSVCVGMIQVLLPIMILALFGAMSRIDRRLMLAAEIHGASRWRAFRTVFFPLSLAGVYSACLLIFISALGFFIVPALIGSPRQTMITQSILVLAETLLNWTDAAALSIVLLVATMVLTIIYDRFFNIDRLWGGDQR
ncbi:ABC transporter permease [Ancylobacter mangrovi]|uniref:ABC transporter permease n=1 Tax=Ancylobacter mangrovi TaxID=2972472 RepID=UPI002163CE0E|nr:ABC transporter permease [Ancylobacter mangrovi]MCS0503990.1 ABC transporter permease [Ancylobacter mangrovi]